MVTSVYVVVRSSPRSVIQGLRANDVNPETRKEEANQEVIYFYLGAAVAGRVLFR